MRFMIIEALSLEEALKRALRHGAAVGCPELDVRAVAEKS